MIYRARLTRFGRVILIAILVGVAFAGHQVVDEYRQAKRDLSTYKDFFVMEAIDGGDIVRVSMDKGHTWAEFRESDGRALGLAEGMEGKNAPKH